MQNRAKKRASCSTCHAKSKLFHMSRKKTVPHVMQKNKLFHMLQKTMQKPCKMRRVRSANPPNPHSPRVPCYMCYMCYMALTRQATEHPLSPGSLLYVLYVLYGIEACILYTQHLNMYQICHCIAHILHFEARTEYIAHIAHIARSWGRVGVQRLGV